MYNLLFSVITCDPPVAIDHTMYTPVLTEHDWNTDILYTCHSDYHYVSGIDTTTCNETGNFPPVDFDCSGSFQIINLVMRNGHLKLVITCGCQSAELQIGGGIEENSTITFLISR